MLSTSISGAPTQVETMWHRIAVDRAAHDEMLAVDAERRAATETILAQCQEQLKEVGTGVFKRMLLGTCWQ